MTEVAVAPRATHFNAHHAVGPVHHLRDVRFWSFTVKTGPTASRIELGVAFKQRSAASLAVIRAFAPLRVEFAGVWAFRAVLAHHAVLLC